MHKFNFLFSFNWKERHPPKTHLSALLSPPTHFTYFRFTTNKTTHIQSKSTFHLFWKKKKEKLLNEGRLLNWENLKALLEKAAAAIPQAATGRLLHGEELPPVSFYLHEGILQNEGASKERSLSSTCSLVKQVWVMWEQKGAVRSGGGFLLTEEKWGFAEVGKRWQVVLGKGAVAGRWGTAMKGSLLMHWQALPSPLPSPRGKTGRLCPAPSWAQAVRALSQSTTFRGTALS